MGKISKTFALFLTLIISISCLTLLTNNPASAQTTVHNVSQTFELNQGVTSGVTIFDLQVGDHIEGFVSVSNLGPYPLGPLALAIGGSGVSYEVVDIYIDDPNWHSLNGNTSFSLTPSNNSACFSFTAQEQGLYRMWAFSGAMDYLQDAKNPVMTLNYEWTGTPIKVSIISPINQVYTKSNISLNYTINRPMDWAGYSLDGAKEVTLWREGYPSPNTTLSGLAIGVHSLTIYTNDSWGNLDTKTVTFTIEKPETGIFGSIYIIPVIAVPIVIACLVLLFYRRHRKTSVVNK